MSTTNPLSISRHALRPFAAPSALTDVQLGATLRCQGTALHLGYQLTGAIDRLRIPAAEPPARRDGLWQSTCFELFIGSSASAAYAEYNFSPSGTWAAYAFHRYREAAPLPVVTPPNLRWFAAADRLYLEAQITLPEPFTDTTRLGLTAVLQTHEGQLHYWALHHPAVKPDFHHADGFTLSFPFCPL